MTTKDVRLALIKHSPFLLKTDIETEERFSFSVDNLYFNDMPIGDYTVREEHDRFAIAVTGSTINKHHFELPLDYKQKPVILSLDTIARPYLDEDQNADTIPLIPKKQIVDDENAEL